MRDFVVGARMLAQGFGIVVRSPRLLALGAIPAVITTFLLVAAVVGLVYWIGDLTAWVTPFADGWADGVRRVFRVAVGVAILGGATVVGVVTFTAVTLLIGGPFYEYIAETVDERLGGQVDGVSASWVRVFVRGLRDSVLLIAVSVASGLLLFFAGFIPLVGQTVVPALVVCVGAWILALELVGVAFGRRGLGLGDRHRTLRRRGRLALGLGVPVYLLCVIPFAAIVVMPAAVAGGTLLAREVLGVRGTGTG